MKNSDKPRQFLVAQVSSRLVAIDLQQVAEVVSSGCGSDGENRGGTERIQVRDCSYTLVYPAEALFGSPEPVPSSYRVLLLGPLNSGNALAVDSVESIIRIGASEVKAYSGITDGPAPEFVSGVILQNEQPVYILNPDKFCRPQSKKKPARSKSR